jgi:hypothetical protein
MEAVVVLLYGNRQRQIKVILNIDKAFPLNEAGKALDYQKMYIQEAK